MKSYALFQICITDEERAHINQHGWDALADVPAFEAKSNLSDKGSEAFVPVKHDVFFRQVATIDAEDLENVFHVGNMGPENQIERHHKMHSPSVGDVVVDLEDGKSYMVNGFGFERINFNVNMARGIVR